MNLLKDGISKIKDRLTKTELQRKLKEATSNEHCHANISLLDEIASKTSNYNDFQQVVSHCIKKLGAKKEKWRKILKTLFLIEHILKVGSPNFYDSMKSDSHMLKNLNSFSFIDTNKADKGETIRQKSKEIVVLLNDKSKLKLERENYAKWKGRIEGVSSSGKVNSVTSSSYSNSVSSFDYNKNYVSKDTKKEEVKELDSESSEESEEEKKKKRKPKKTQETVEKIMIDEDTGIKPSLKVAPSSNISIKKPSVAKKQTAEIFNPFDTLPVQSKTKQTAGDINDIFSTKSTLEVKSSNASNGNLNNNNLIDFISFTSPNQTKSNTITSNNTVNNLPFDLNFNLTHATPSSSSYKLNDMPNINMIPTSSYSSDVNKPKLETNQLLKMMYSDNNVNQGQNTQNFQYAAYNNNVQFSNAQKPQANPFELQFNNMNISGNSSMSNGNQMSWSNNGNNNLGNANQGYNVGNNFPTSGFRNVNNMNSMNNMNNVNNFNNVTYNNNSNTAANFSIPAYNYSNNSKNVQSKFNDDDFKEVEEDPFKIDNNSNNKGKGLNSLLDNKLVDLSNLKGENKKTQSSNPNNNFNFYY